MNTKRLLSTATVIACLAVSQMAWAVTAEEHAGIDGTK